MRKTITLHLHVSDILSGAFDELKNDFVNFSDVSFVIEENQYNQFVTISVSYDIAKMIEDRKRNAGPKEKRKYDYDKIISIDQVKEDILKYGRIQAAENYGIHYSTMYRRIQKAKRNNQTYIKI